MAHRSGALTEAVRARWTEVEIDSSARSAVRSLAWKLDTENGPGEAYLHENVTCLYTVSTRALFGNYRLRPPFPRLQSSPASVADLDPGDLDPRRWGATVTHSCSVCDRPIEQGGPHQVWISLRVATDVLPLLVNACSATCVTALPGGARDYIPAPHKGGRIDQPASNWD